MVRKHFNLPFSLVFECLTFHKIHKRTLLYGVWFLGLFISTELCNASDQIQQKMYFVRF